eukprot:1466482-Amphidinium_carterae.1
MVKSELRHRRRRKRDAPTMGSRARRRQNTEVQDASGQELEDAAAASSSRELKAESGKAVLMNMRLTEVHKPLASARRALRQNVAFLIGEGGVLFPRTACQIGNLK